VHPSHRSARADKPGLASRLEVGADWHIFVRASNITALTAYINPAMIMNPPNIHADLAGERCVCHDRHDAELIKVGADFFHEVGVGSEENDVVCKFHGRRAHVGDVNHFDIQFFGAFFQPA